MIIVFILTLSFNSCESYSFIGRRGTLENWSDVGGCGWVIVSQLGNEQVVYEPINLDRFNITLEEGQKVRFRFIEFDQISICQVGPTIELVFIRESIL